MFKLRASKSSRTQGWLFVLVATGFLGVLLVLLGSWQSRLIPADDPLAGFGHFLLSSARGQALLAYSTLVGISLIMLSWLILWRFREVVPWRAVVLLWGVPLVFALPTMSFDLFNYVEQGWAVLHGHNPYITPMGQAGGFVDFAGPWAGKTVGYPPLALMIQAFLVWVAGASPFWSLMTMKLMGIAGLVCAYFGFKISGEQKSSAVIKWAVFANPAILVHALNDGHNDALAGGLAVLGVALAARLTRVRGVVAGAALVGLAGAIKQPVLVFLFAVAVLSMRQVSPRLWFALSFGRRWIRLIVPGIISGVVGGACFLLPGWITGWNLGWTTATGLSGYGRSTPLRYYYEAVTQNLHQFFGTSLPRSIPDAYPQTATIIMVILGVGVLVFLGTKHPVEAIIIALAAYFLLGRSVQSWYAVWFLFALVFVRMNRRIALVLVGFSAWMLAPMWVRPWGPNVHWYSQFTWSLAVAAVAMVIFWLLSKESMSSKKPVDGQDLEIADRPLA